MKRKNFSWMLILSVLFMGYSLVGSDTLASEKVSYTGDPITIRFSTHASLTHIMYKIGFGPGMKLMEEKSNGKLIIKTFPGQSLHSVKDGFKALRSDITDITHGYPIYHPKSLPINLVISLPFAFPNAYVGSIVAEELYLKYLKEECENMGSYLFDYHTTSVYHLISKKPVRALEDIKGMKIRTPAGPAVDIIKKLGGVPVFLSSPEMYPALQRGMVDGVFHGYSAFSRARLYEIAKYVTTFGATVSTSPEWINRKTFDALPQDLKRIVYNTGRIFSQVMAAAYEEADEAALASMKKAGVEIITLSDKEMDRMKSAVEPLWKQFISKHEASGFPARELVKDLKRLTKKYSTWTPEEIMKQVTDHPIHGIIDGM